MPPNGRAQRMWLITGVSSTDMEPAPLRLVLGSVGLQSPIDTLKRRIEGFEVQRELATSTDFPTGD